MNHYRVTRPNVYANPNCPGHADKSARQGHYANAAYPEEAAQIVRERLKLSPDELLDVQLWQS